MKKHAILLSLLMFVSFTFAQTGQRNKAFNYLKSGNLPKAKTAIDAATVHAKTINDPKTWLYKGRIYLEISKTPLGDLIGITSLDAATEGYDALLKARELDTENELKEDMDVYFEMAAEILFNVAVVKYNEKTYAEAGQLFDKSYSVASGFGKIDTTALFNGALAYEKAELLDLAKINYGKLVNMHFDNPIVYYSYCIMLKADGDTTLAVQVVDRGRAMFPDDFNLVLAQTNLFLETKQTDKALDNLRLALTMDTTNSTIYHAVGAMFDVIFNDEQYSDEKRLSAFDESESSYLRAIELNPELFDAIYNLGALYFNKGVFYLTKADALPYGDKEYEPLKELGDELLNKKALPYLEKALSIKGDDYNTLFSLKQIYSRTGETEKYKVVNQKMSEVGAPDQEQ
ncbi:MAG: hypothetical protein GY834_15600 [Bacteroidetes bacterium]|nr:hypothetical protein [Bacteroidota bacterium]